MAEVSGLAAFEAVLDDLGAAGRRVRLWLRDDDATDASPALARLLGLAEDHGVEPLIAAIPAHTGEGLARALEGRAAAVAVHGLAHANHAPPDEKRCELGPGRPLATVAAELRQAREHLAALIGEPVLPVLVPPWNRIAPEVVEALPGAGFTGLSTFGRRARVEAADGLLQVNTHLDLIDWRGTPRGRPIGELFQGLAGILQRSDRAPDFEPVGILTHHRVHDANAWGFMEALMAIAASHQTVEWVGARAVFSETPQRRPHPV